MASGKGHLFSQLATFGHVGAFAYLTVVGVSANPPVVDRSTSVVLDRADLILYASSLQWQGTPGDVFVEATLVRGANAIAQGTAYVDRSGSGVVSLIARDSDTPVQISPGDRIGVRVDGTTRRAIDVPTFSARVDPVAQLVRGIAEPDAVVTVTRHVDGRWFQTQLVGSTVAGSDGRYELAYAPSMVRGFEGMARIVSPSGDVVRAAFATDVIDVDLTGHALAGASSYGSVVEIAARSSDGRVESTRVTVPRSPSSFAWRTQLPPEFSLAPGTVLTATIAAAFDAPRLVLERVPQLSVEVDPATGAIAGIGPPGTILGLSLTPWKGSVITRTVETRLDGTFHLDDVPFDARRGFSVHIEHDTGGVFRFRATYVRRSIAVGLYASYVEGYLGTPGAGLTVTVTDAHGDPKASAVVMSRDDGSFILSFLTHDDHRVEEQVFLDPGDVVDVDWSEGDPVRLVLPDVSAHVDVDGDRVHGTAPIGAALQATMTVGGTSIVRGGSVDAGGAFDIAFDDGLDMVRPATGALMVFMDGGFLVTVGLAATNLTVVGDASSISGVGPVGRHVEARLESASGALLAQATARVRPRLAGQGAVDPWFVTLQDRVGDPVVPSSGDVLEVVVGNDVLTVSIPRLGAEIDVEHDMVYVYAEPNMVLSVALRSVNGIGHSTRSTSSRLVMDASGTARLSLHGEWDVLHNDEIFLQHDNADGHQFVKRIGVPGITLDIDGATLTGYAPSGAVVRIGHSHAASEERYWSAAVDATGRFRMALTTRSGNVVPLVAGDRIHVESMGNGSSPIADFAVPDFTLDLDASDGVVTGRAPSPGSVFVAVEPRYPRSGFEGGGSSGYRNVRIGSSGTYTVSLAALDAFPVDARPGQHVRGIVALADGTRVTRSATVPIVNLQQGGAMVCGYAAPGRAVRVDVLQGPGEGAGGTSTAEGDARFQLTLSHPTGARVALGTGSRVRVTVAADVFDVTLPRFDSVAEWTFRAPNRSVLTTRVSGWVEPNTELYGRAPDERCLSADDPILYTFNGQHSGAFSFASAPYLQRGQALTVGHYVAPSWHRHYRLLVRPLVRAVLGTRRVEGKITPGMRAVLEWRDAEGQRLGSLAVVGDSHGRFAGELTPSDERARGVIRAGEVIEALLGNDRETISIGALDFDFDRRSGAVLTLAPGQPLRLELDVPRANRTFVVQDVADAAGRFEFRPEDALPGGMWSIDDVAVVRAVAIDRDGHEIARESRRSIVANPRRALFPLLFAGR